MPNDEKRTPTAEETDISKAQAQQQPPQAGKQQPETSEQGQPLGTGENRQSQDESLQGDTLSQQRTDIEGASLQSERSEAEGGFVGSESDADSSSELIEDEDFAKGGQGAPEGK